jgi:hypothetical protein
MDNSIRYNYNLLVWNPPLFGKAVLTGPKLEALRKAVITEETADSPLTEVKE